MTDYNTFCVRLFHLVAYLVFVGWPAICLVVSPAKAVSLLVVGCVIVC
jgi:hypothetical protein